MIDETVDQIINRWILLVKDSGFCVCVCVCVCIFVMDGPSSQRDICYRNLELPTSQSYIAAYHRDESHCGQKSHGHGWLYLAQLYTIYLAVDENLA